MKNREMVVRVVRFARQFQVCTGNLFQPMREAKELGVSKRTLTRDMQMLREFGYVFEYDSHSQMYWGKAPSTRVL
jgi:biotin operon repressor